MKKKINTFIDKIAGKLLYDDLNLKYDYTGFGFSTRSDWKEGSNVDTFNFNEQYLIPVIAGYKKSDDQDWSSDRTFKFNLNLKINGKKENQEFLEEVFDSTILGYFYPNNNSGISTGNWSIHEDYNNNMNTPMRKFDNSLEKEAGIEDINSRLQNSMDELAPGAIIFETQDYEYFDKADTGNPMFNHMKITAKLILPENPQVFITKTFYLLA